MADLPSGTVTFLLTDVEGSTALWEDAPSAMEAALARHDALVEGCVAEPAGTHIRPRGEGDSRFAVFRTAHDAVAAAIAIQRAFAQEWWPTPRPIAVRIGVHTGEAQVRDGDYYGSAVNRCARLRGIGHGGQILLSEVTTNLVRDRLPPDSTVTDLGEHRLRDLSRTERVYQLHAAGLPDDFPSLVSLDARPNNLPAQPTPLVGRDREVQALRSLLLREDPSATSGQARLVTLTGPGGTGKTRLALQVAADLLNHFPDGVFFTDLAPINDPDVVIWALARVLGLRETGGRSIWDSVAAYLKERRLLLLLDNFEHLLAAAPVVAMLLATCPSLTVLVTSRATLHIRGEREFPVPPLDLPGVGEQVSADHLVTYPAVALFAQRANDAQPAFALTTDNAATVVEVCRRVDGLPLAIELAAARVKLLPPQALLARLDRRLSILTDGPLDLPARQRTLRDTIGWSYGLLDEEERRVFRLLGAFVGGCTLDAIERVASGESRVASDRTSHSQLATLDSQLDVVASLVDKSLVRQITAGSDTRFILLETIRAFAVDQLEATDEAAEVRRRHAEDVRQLVETADPLLIGADQVTWLDRLEVEHGNVIAALNWARDTRAATGAPDAGRAASLTGLRIAGALHWYWWLGGHVAEGRRWLAEILTWDVGDAGQVARLRALYAAGTLELIQGAYDEARRLLDAAASLAETLGDPVTHGRCLAYRGIVETYFCEAGQIDIDVAMETCRLAVAVLDRTDDTWGQALALSQVGAHARRDGEFARAETLLRQSVDLAESTGERYLLGSCLPKLGNLYRDHQDYDAADPLYRQALAAFRDIRELWWTGRCMMYLALTAYGLGDPHRAARLLGCSDAVLDSGGARRNPREEDEYQGVTQQLVTVLGKAGFTATWTDGRAMSLEQAVAYAIDGAPWVTGAA